MLSEPKAPSQEARAWVSLTNSAFAVSPRSSCGTFLKRQIAPYLLEPCLRRRAVFYPTPASRMRYAVRDEPCMTRLTTMAAMPASTALACGDDGIPPRMSRS